MSEALRGKVAVVTGGGTGIGAGIASRLAADGAYVAISGRRAEPLEEVAGGIRAAGGRVLCVSCDTGTEDGVQKLFERTEQELGPVDVLVNNAGIAGPVASIWEQEFAGWEETLRVNLSGPWLCSRAAARSMIPRRSGTIVNIGSISGKRPLAKRTPYTSTKMGLLGLTKTLALELGDHNITVNCISPGLVRTPRLGELAEKAGITPEQFETAAGSAAALKRISEPEDVAALVAFLASPAARNITGVDITVDGGMVFG